MLLIQNAYIKPITGPDIPGGCLLADGGRIAAIAPHIDPPEGCTVIDAGGRLLTPPLACGVLPGVLRAELLERGEAFEQETRGWDAAAGETRAQRQPTRAVTHDLGQDDDGGQVRLAGFERDVLIPRVRDDVALKVDLANLGNRSR